MWRPAADVLRDPDDDPSSVDPLPALARGTLRGRLAHGWDPVDARAVPPNDRDAVLARDAAVLRELLTAPAPLSRPELVRRTGHTPAQVYRALRRLRAAGVVVSKTAGPLSRWAVTERLRPPR